DVAANRLLLVQWWFLRQQSDGGARLEEGVTVVRMVEPRHDPQDRGLTRSVRPDDPDLRAGEEGGADIVEDDLLPNGLAYIAHGVDELGHTRDRRARVSPA